MFRKILIANRGEIACRIIKTAKKMGITTVAVYSTPDKDSLHVTQADEAYWIGEAPSSESYLNQKVIIDAALKANAEAIHPGYGFLSENPDFAKACSEAHISFIGPSAESMQLMASKQQAKQLLEKTRVPLTPGYHGEDQTDKILLSEAKNIGFPVLLKAAAGGGGKGMRAVQKESDFISALEGARREALSSFGNDIMVIEKLVKHPRHVEVQIMADHHGQMAHLFDRDCSVQRRHQKVIEEAPAPNLPHAQREKMAEAALTVAEKIHYQGAGTVEFLVDGDQFYFMEMNTRLQVEHPVTEMITGIDLVEWQIRIAANEPLPLKQEEIVQTGHAVECRVYAEDPKHNFMPSIGEISFLEYPQGEGIRVDTHMTQGSSISQHYDPMIAKLISYGSNREEALMRIEKALQQFHIEGIKTNIAFLQQIIQHPLFQQEKLSTDLLDKDNFIPEQSNIELYASLAACIEYKLFQSNIKDDLYKEAFGWTPFQNRTWTTSYLIEKQTIDVKVEALNNNQLNVIIGNQAKEFTIYLRESTLIFEANHIQKSITFQADSQTMTLFIETGPVKLSKVNHNYDTSSGNTDPQLKSPMPATIVSILKKKGDKVSTGDALMILEAMKMEHTITAPNTGIIKDILFSEGNQVSEGAELINIDTGE